MDQTSNFDYCFRIFFRYIPCLQRKIQLRIENQVNVRSTCMRLTCRGRKPTHSLIVIFIVIVITEALSYL